MTQLPLHPFLHRLLLFLRKSGFSPDWAERAGEHFNGSPTFIRNVVFTDAFQDLLRPPPVPLHRPPLGKAISKPEDPEV